MDGKWLLMAFKTTFRLTIPFSSVTESNWSIEMANEIVSNVWECEQCKNSFNITGMQRLQHIMGKTLIILNHLPSPPFTSQLIFFLNL